MNKKCVSEVSENLKSFKIVTGDQNIANNFLSMTSVCKSSRPENNLINKNIQKNNVVELVANNHQGVSDLSEQYNDDDEVFDIFTNKQSIVCSRSTQTTESNYNKTETNILITNELNHPATIFNASFIRRIVTPNQYNQELILTKTQLYNIHRNYQKLKARFHKLHADYQKLMGITRVLTTSLQKSAVGEFVDLNDTLKTCMNIYPDVFGPNMHDCKANFMDHASDMRLIHKSLNASLLSTIPSSPKFLDYKKIKFHLIHGNMRIKLLLLQALRWKMTLNQTEERDETLHEYIKNDLLGLHKEIPGECDNKAIISSLLISMDFFIPYSLQQSITRIINTFASLKSGRDYLSINSTILNAIIQCLDSSQIKSIDAFTCDMIIATLQKLSLRRHQRLNMISAGLVEWLVYHLKAEYQGMGTYRLEYATALLMNLSLQKEAQIRIAAMASILLSTLTMLLSSEHLPVLPYVNGALNNFLTNNDINEEAKTIDLESVLEYYRQHRSGELRKHLDHILMRHKRKPNETIDHYHDEDDDDREELDILEDELDEMDPVKVEPGELFGETLLTSCYSVTMKVLQNDNKFSHDSFSLSDREMSPRLTPVNNSIKYQNPIKLKILSSDNKINQYNMATIDFNDYEGKKSVKIDSIPISKVDNGIYNSGKKIHVTPDESHKLVTLDKNVEEKVNSYKTIRATKSALFSVENKEHNNCPVHPTQSAGFSESSLHYHHHHHHHHHQGLNTKESSFIIESISTETISTEQLLEKFEIAGTQKDKIAHHNLNNSEVVTGLLKEEEAFVAKPKILRTPTHNGSTMYNK